MKRILSFVYGLLCYAVGMASLVYLAGFLANVAVPKSISSGAEAATGTAWLVNLGLLLLFGLQHSVMARPTFKKWITQFVPKPIERSTYVLGSGLAFFLLFWQWRPMGGVVLEVTHPAGQAVLYTLYALGWLVVVATTFLINHFELFGLQQVWQHLRDRESRPPRFVTPGPYRFVRHPLYIGWFMVVWFTPLMTTAHLLFAAGTTLYILIAIYFEERNLMGFHPEYAEYRKRVGMLLPRLTGRGMQREPGEVSQSSTSEFSSNSVAENERTGMVS